MKVSFTFISCAVLMLAAVIGVQVLLAQEVDSEQRDPCFYDPDLPECQPSTPTPEPTATR